MEQQEKSTENESSKKPKQEELKSATFGSDVAQPPAIVSDADNLDVQEEYDESEKKLRQFDMNMAYGPCVGMTRLARWERAQKLGLNPPQEIETLLKSGKVKNKSLWDGQI